MMMHRHHLPVPAGCSWSPPRTSRCSSASPCLLRLHCPPPHHPLACSSSSSNTRSSSSSSAAHARSRGASLLLPRAQRGPGAGGGRPNNGGCGGRGERVDVCAWLLMYARAFVHACKCASVRSVRMQAHACTLLHAFRACHAYDLCVCACACAHASPRPFARSAGVPLLPLIGPHCVLTASTAHPSLPMCTSHAGQTQARPPCLLHLPDAHLTHTLLLPPTPSSNDQAPHPGGGSSSAAAAAEAAAATPPWRRCWALRCPRARSAPGRPRTGCAGWASG